MNDHLNPIHFIATGLFGIICLFIGIAIGLFLPLAVKKINERHQRKAIDQLIKQNRSCDEGIMNVVINKNSLF